MTSLDKPAKNREKASQIRTYSRAESVVFFRTKEAFGGLSNMASGYPLNINGIEVPSSEGLYQACRFTHLPAVQEEIIRQSSPMNAKAVSSEWRSKTRADWLAIRVTAMRWCLRVKALQNKDTFLQLLLSTGSRPIVELSRRDDFWGALEVTPGTLTGRNVLGRLLMELRAEYDADSDSLNDVAPPNIKDFALFGQPVETVNGATKAIAQQAKLC
ncbi:NADAR family protein [Stenotrophomonas sp. ATCM1_4]|uniref:NADAR family protein n=1 Tax=Stenotrophomonas sp. ATCM1_4 TaxID=2259330 RepID=UPI001FB57AB7|nr:NADAR family protein [Stenotrophomonas sp. ATCM1_4]